MENLKAASADMQPPARMTIPFQLNDDDKVSMPSEIKKIPHKKNATDEISSPVERFSLIGLLSNILTVFIEDVVFR